jgi:hypothetical protein
MARKLSVPILLIQKSSIACNHNFFVDGGARNVEDRTIFFNRGSLLAQSIVITIIIIICRPWYFIPKGLEINRKCEN